MRPHCCKCDKCASVTVRCFKLWEEDRSQGKCSQKLQFSQEGGRMPGAENCKFLRVVQNNQNVSSRQVRSSSSFAVPRYSMLPLPIQVNCSLIKKRNKPLGFLEPEENAENVVCLAVCAKGSKIIGPNYHWLFRGCTTVGFSLKECIAFEM